MQARDATLVGGEEGRIALTRDESGRDICWHKPPQLPKPTVGT
jgi:hypothetical protein